jgi:hypothetical protein
VFVLHANPNLKRSVAEAVIATEAMKLGVDVYRPIAEHGRVDLVFGVGDRLWRVQCKWGCSQQRPRRDPGQFSYESAWAGRAHPFDLRG